MRKPLQWNDIVIMHDNARPHSASNVTTFLNNHGANLLKQAAYSPDFNLLDRWIFAKLQIARRNRNFNSDDDITKFVTGELNILTSDELNHQFDSLKNDLMSVITSHGNYIV